MRIMVLGLRAFPDVQGGVEIHAENLYPILAALGCKVEVIARSRYMQNGTEHGWRGVCFRRLWCPKPRLNGVEAFVHSFLGVLCAALRRPDVLHIHGIGPAIMTPLARLLGLKVIVTYHSEDYAREKWGKVARSVLRAGESLGMKHANEVIVVSRRIHETVKRRYRRNAVLLPNGIVIPNPPTTKRTLEKFGLDSGRYILLVSRFDPGKRHIDLIRAFEEANLLGWKLVYVGGLEPQNEYTRSIVSAAHKIPNVVLTGFQKGSELQEIYANAGLFVLPSSHEGFPIVLLEAISYGLPVLASKIAGNMDIGLSKNQYFNVGDISMLSKLLKEFCNGATEKANTLNLQRQIMGAYNWNNIARRTFEVYRSVLK